MSSVRLSLSNRMSILLKSRLATYIPRTAYRKTRLDMEKDKEQRLPQTCRPILSGTGSFRTF